MEHETGKILSKILGKRDLEKIPPDIATKVEKYFDQRFEEFLTTKALHSTAQRNIDEVRSDYEKLFTNSQDKDAKIESAQQNADELRKQLDLCKAEVKSLSEAVQNHESEISTYRKERNDAFDERDLLQNTVERQNGSIDRLQKILATLETQLDVATTAKCEALSKCHEIESREHSINYKEKFMEQERNLLTDQINNLSDNLQKTSSELQSIRHENNNSRMQLEAELAKKTNDLQITSSTLTQYIETNQQLTVQVEELNLKLREQSEESTKMMEHYHKELLNKTKLADLYQENVDDRTAENNELKNAYIELKKHLSETTDSYGELETKLRNIDVVHQKDLDAKDEHIKELVDELRNANELLKAANDENLQDALERLTPTAAAASKRLKSNITLSEIYTLYVKAVEDLQLKERELNQAEVTLKSILAELEEQAPTKKRQAIEFQKISAANEELSAQLEKYVNERVTVREELIVTKDRFGYLERENKKLKISQADLSRQLVYLLKEIEQMRGGMTYDQDQSISSDSSANELISKRLVTFSDIVELQDNNQKLLLLVRDLSSKLEEFEETQNNTNLAAFEAQIAQYTRRVQDMEAAAEIQNKMVATCILQKDRFKHLYYEIMKDVGKIPSGTMETSMGAGEMQMDASESDSNNQLPNGTVNSDAKDNIIADLEKKVKDYASQLRTLREEYDEYRREKLANDKLGNEQYLAMRNEVRELTTSNCKLMTSANFHSEQIKTQQKNTALLKKQIQTLEERNRIYDQTIAKHEATIMYLREHSSTVQKNCSSAELKCEELRRQSHKLAGDVSRLSAERDSLYRERLSMNMLQSNLELIKTSMERTENDGRLQMEQRYDNVQRECAALRRRLQEEQDHYRDKSADLKRKTDTAVQKMNDELAQADSLRSQIEQTRQELVNKNQQIDELSRKLQESLTPCKSDNPIAKANKKIKELQNIVDQRTAELEQLKRDYNASNAKFDQLSKMAAEWEADSKEQHEIFDDYKTKMVAELSAARLSETNLKSRVEEMETEIRLQITGAQLTDTDTTSQLHKAQTELKEALTKISENNRELRELRAQCQLLKSSLQTIEQKYSNEMLLHSSDIQALTTCKDELNKVQDQMQKLRDERDSSAELLKSHRDELEVSFGQHASEKKELETRLQDLDSQNAALHDQLQLMSATFATDFAGKSTDVSLSESLVDSSFANRSLTEEDTKASSSDQLMSVIKYMRKEKDIAIAKLEISKSENIRLNTEADILKKKLNEATTNSINSERPAAESNVVSALKYEEIMRKVETLNAMTDSNRVLREERDALHNKVVSLTERVTKVEDDLFPLQETNRELVAKIDEQTSENQSLRNTADQWRKRCNNLVDRSQKNPEEFKRLQTERENLAKMLTAERETIRLVNDELKAIRDEKARLDAELSTVLKNCQAHLLEKKKFSDDLNALRAVQQRTAIEIMELKSAVIQKEDEIKKITDDLAAAEAEVTSSKGKEAQIRKIAKRYKDTFTVQAAKIEELAALIAAQPLSEQAAASAITARAEADRVNAARISALTTQITALQEELDQQRRENDNLKKGEDAGVLSEARARIKALTEANAAITREHQTSKNALQSCEQNRSEHELLVAGLKSQFEGRINRLEKEMTEQDTSNKEVIARLTRENENLNLRANQLHRQLQQQGSKPSTSSGAIEKGPSDASRTANVKPMAGPSGQQSATVTPRRGGDTPLASIRPMSVQNSRTAAVLPTSQTSNVAAVQGSSSGSVTALVPPQQQVHTTGQGSSAEAMSSSPTSSHTDYMPATSSAVVAAVPPMGTSSASPAESSQEAESASTVNTGESTSTGQAVVQQQQQQTVALVSPRVEVIPQNVLVPLQQSPHQIVSEQNQAASTSGGGGTTSSSSSSSLMPAAMSTHHQASSSNTVTTTQAGGHKRPRDAEGDSSTGVEDSTTVSSDNKTSPKNKRTRLGEQAFQGVSESGLDVEYQVPTSSQRDQEDDNVIVVDSEDEDEEDGMVDEGPAQHFEDEADNGESYEMEASYDQEQDEEGEGPDIDEDNAQHDNNEVEVDDSSEAPAQSTATIPSDVGTSAEETIGTSPQNLETQQIQAISSGSEARSSTTWHGDVRQSSQNISIIQQAFEETGDDSIVPSTPTLYVPRRADGFSEAVSSPHPQVPQQLAARFTFNDQAGTSGTRSAIVPTSGSSIEAMDDTRIDLSQLDPSTAAAATVTASPAAAVPAQQVSPSQRASITEPTDVVVDLTTAEAAAVPVVIQAPAEPVAGPSGSSVPEIVICNPAEFETTDDASPSEGVDDSKDVSAESKEIQEEMGADGVTSEGEKTPNEGIQVEEGREAEASTHPYTRSRTPRRGQSSRGRGRHNSNSNVERPTPIVWQYDVNQGEQHEPHGEDGQQQPRYPRNARNSRRMRHPGQFPKSRY